MYTCDILADSISDENIRLTTFLVTYPRIIHAEFMTHAMLARNGESSRARPVLKNVEEIRNHPFIPEEMGKNQSGMQWSETVENEGLSQRIWEMASQSAALWAEGLAELDVHKSLGNRLIEPFKWYTAIYTGTDWDNFFALRTHKDAQPQFRVIAEMMQDAYLTLKPYFVGNAGWHLPFVSRSEITGDFDWAKWCAVSAGRCARVSYLTHDGRRDIDADIDLATNRLKPHGHMSPFAHQARPFSNVEWELVDMVTEFIKDHSDDPFAQRMLRNIQYCAQFRGWWQQRADIPFEDDYSKLLTSLV